MPSISHDEAVRQLLLQSQHQLFADDLGGHEFVADIGDLVLRDRAAATPAGDCAMSSGSSLEVRLACAPRSARPRRTRPSVDKSSMNGSSRSFGCARSTLLISRMIGRPTAFSSLERALVLVGPAQRLDHEQVHVRIGERRRAPCGSCSGSSRAVSLRMDAGQVDEDDLHAGLVQHAVDAVRVVCGFGRHDADLAGRAARSAASTCRRSAGRPARRSRSAVARCLGRRRRFGRHDLLLRRRRSASSTRLRGFLLGAAPARALALAAQAERRHLAAGDEPLLVRFAADVVERVPRQRQAARLQLFLQPRLRVLERLPRPAVVRSRGAEQPARSRRAAASKPASR